MIVFKNKCTHVIKSFTYCAADMVPILEFI